MNIDMNAHDLSALEWELGQEQLAARRTIAVGDQVIYRAPDAVERAVVMYVWSNDCVDIEIGQGAARRLMHSAVRADGEGYGWVVEAHDA